MARNLGLLLGGFTFRASALSMPPAPGGVKSFPVLDDIFNIVDRDHTKSISQEEFDDAMANGIIRNSDHRDDIFDAIDRDHTKSISPDEFDDAMMKGVLGSSLKNTDGSKNFPPVEIRHFGRAIEPGSAAKRVTCIGDSITEGTCSSSNKSYPEQLQGLLGDEYSVSSFAADGRGLLETGFYPIWNEEELLQEAFSSKPDIVVIGFGTNDAKITGFSEEEFRDMYDKMIKQFKALVPVPQVVIMTPPPVYDASSEGHSRSLAPIVNEQLAPIITDIASNHALELVDNFASFSSKCRDYDSTTCTLIAYEAGYNGDGETCKNDFVHPSDDGYAIIAENVKATIASSKP